MKLRIARGATLLSPIPIGLNARGEIAHEYVCTPIGGVSKLISGQTGAGKTQGETPVILTCAALQADVILLDPVKGIQSYQHVAGALQMYEIDPGRILRVLKRLLSHTLPARTNHLAREGLTKWTPQSTLRYLIIHVEEAWRVADSSALVGLGNAIRSAGGRIVHSLQQPTFDQMPTVLRNQMGAYRAYGLQDKDYNDYSLPENVIAAGANPAQWGNEDPGMHYCVMPGMDIRTKVTPVRAWDDGTGVNTFAAAAQYVSSILGPMCPVTAGSLGDLWDSHTPPLELIKQVGIIVPGPVTQAALAGTAARDVPVPTASAADNDDPELHDPDDPDYLEAVAELADIDPDDFDEPEVVENPDGTITVTDEEGEFVIDADDLDPDDPDWADPDEPTHPVVARMIGDPPKDGVSREEFLQLVDVIVTEFVNDADRDVLERRDFIGISADSGWAPATYYKYLGRDPRITKTERGWIRAGDSGPDRAGTDAA